MSCISQIVSIRKIVIISLAKHFDSYFNYCFAMKNALYVAKTVVDLSITYKKSKISWKSDLVIDFPNIKVAQSINYNNKII